MLGHVVKEISFKDSQSGGFLSNRAEWFVNFWRAQVENHFCEIIQNLDKKLRRADLFMQFW